MLIDAELQEIRKEYDLEQEPMRQIYSLCYSLNEECKRLNKVVESLSNGIGDAHGRIKELEDKLESAPK